MASSQAAVMRRLKLRIGSLTLPELELQSNTPFKTAVRQLDTLDVLARRAAVKHLHSLGAAAAPASSRLAACLRDSDHSV